MLTSEIVRELRKPFAPEQIKWKVQTNPKEGDEWAVVVAYIDARDVTERLDIATGGNWANEYTIPQMHAGSHHALECRLTVCGVTRCDVGSVPVPREGDDATKDLYSDALKRAAVQFGVASHVYRFPNVKAKVQKFGRSFFLTFKAQDELTELNRHLIAGTRWPKFSEIKVSGDSFGANGKPELFDTQSIGNGTSYVPPVAVAPVVIDTKASEATTTQSTDDLIDLPEFAAAVKKLRNAADAIGINQPAFTRKQAGDRAALETEYTSSRLRIHDWINSHMEGVSPLEVLSDQMLMDLAYATAGL